jgi:hypothetical protein
MTEISLRQELIAVREGAARLAQMQRQQARRHSEGDLEDRNQEGTKNVTPTRLVKVGLTLTAREDSF